MPNMNSRCLLTTVLCLIICGQGLAHAQEIDKELSDLAEKLAVSIKEKNCKKVAVVDFTDLQGTTSGELGKYIAEQLTVNFVMGKKDFAVLDRAHLKSILAEHKLTSLGLVDPDNAKRLGQFAGVDALILGTIIPKSQSIGLTAKVITTDTAEIVGAARAEFKSDTNVQNLISHPATESVAEMLNDDKPSVIKTFGDLRVEVQPLKIINGNQFTLTMVLTNQNSKKSIWVAIGTDLMGTIKGQITDSAGAEFTADRTGNSGISLGCFAQYGYVPNTFSPATELKPKDAVTATIKFVPREQASATSGSSRLQLEILCGRNYDNSRKVAGDVTINNLVITLPAQ